MWGGRFAAGPASVMREINASIPFDKRLWKQDIAGSKAHVAMLAKQGIVDGEDAQAITEGLNRIAAEYEAAGVPVDLDLEDIHMVTESRLAELIGPAAGRLHTARSRNDQVATDFRLWVRDAIDEVEMGLQGLSDMLLARAEEHADAVMPGFTHLQSAQPVTLGHHLMAYHEMVRRDRSRFADARARLNECPLGAAALAGTGFPIDRHATAAALGFAKPTDNSLDSVSDRDFALDYLMAATQCSLHLSPPGGGVHHLGEPALRLRETARCLFDRQLDHAAEAQSRRRRAGARPFRADHGLHERALRDDEGPAARLFEGHAGRQAAGVRGA